MKTVPEKSLDTVSDRFSTASRAKAAGRRAGFSLIELLTVVVIILILAGVLYRISGYVTQRAGRARAAYELELLRNALDEYYAIYGHYPPGRGADFTDTANIVGRNRYPGSWGYYEERYPGSMPTQQDVDWNNLGLVYYLREQFTAASDSDGRASDGAIREYERRIKPFLDDLTILTDFSLRDGRGSVPGEAGTLPYSNRVVVLRDPFGSEWAYKAVPDDSPEPQSYILYSKGPDREDGTADDIGRDRWTD